MKRSAAVLAVTVATLASAAAAAFAVTPPAGTPDLAKMTIRASDLQPGSIVSTDGYQNPPSGFVAVYERDYKLAQLTHGGPVFALQTQVQLTASAALAHKVVQLERVEFGSQAGHRLLERAIVQSAGGSVKARNVRFGSVQRIAPGSGSFRLRVTLLLGARTVTAEIMDVGKGRVIELLVAVVPGRRVPSSLSLTLSGDVVRHIGATLASSGSTGATGTG